MSRSANSVTSIDPDKGNSYDLVEYRGYPFQQTHPDRLATLGTAFGLRPAPATACRVLELGCGDGGNLTPMAFTLPESRFIGIDLSANAIASGQAVIAELGLSNIELRHGDIMNIDSSYGRFDYIIAHGVYSWVPDEVQERIMALCRELLAPHGVAYVSYNTYPGHRLREVTRDMMMFHTRGIGNPAEMVDQGLALLKLLLQRFPGEEEAKADLYGALLVEQLELLTKHRHAEEIYHDDMGAINTPVYFHQFAARAERHGLQYLGEADYFEMQDYLYPEPIREFLEQFDDEQIITKEQYLDFLKCRVFRQTLLCRAEAAVDRNMDSALIEHFYLSSPARMTSPEPDLKAGVVAEFCGQRGARLKTDHPLAKAALLHLGRVWPLAVGWGELMQSARAILSEANSGLPPEGESALETAALADILLAACGSDLVRLQLQPSLFVTEVSERPVASNFARMQAARGPMVTNLKHESVEIDDVLGRKLLLWLDGSRDHAALRDEMISFMSEHGAFVQKDGSALNDDSEVRSRIASAVETYLQKLSRMALLVR